MLLTRFSADELSESEYRNKITYATYIWAVLVIMLHTYNIDTYTRVAKVWGWRDNSLWNATQVLEHAVDSFTAIAVPGFFLVSGYLFYQNFEPQKLLKKWKRRIKTYVIPYLIWTLFPYLFYVMVTHSPLHQYMNMPIVKLSMRSMLKAVLASEYSVLWFLRYLIIYTILAPVLYLLLKNRKVPVGVVSVILLMIIQHWGMLAQISIFYVLGGYIGLNHKRILHYRYTLFDRISLFMLVLCIVGVVLMGKNNCLSQWEIGIVLILYWNVLNWLPLNRKPAWYISISFFMYCTHSIILESVEKVLFTLGQKYVWMPLVDYIMAPVCTLAIIYFAAYVLRKYCPTVWKVVTGERG